MVNPETTPTLPPRNGDAPSSSAPALVIPVPRIPRIVPVAQLVGLMGEYKKLQDAIDNARPDLLITIDNRPYRKKSYWALIARAMNIRLDLVSEERFRMESVLPGTGEVLNARVVQTVYRATIGDEGATELSSLGDGACSEDEPRLNRTYHNIRSRAHTRGWIRAVSNLVAFGEPSAEDHSGYNEPGAY